MAKKTRYPNRTAAKPSAKRTRPASGDAPLARIRPADAADAASTRAARPIDRPDDDQPMRASSSGLTEDELRRAEQLEAEAAAKERAAIAESLRRRNRAEAAALGADGDVNAPLAVRAAHEYAYVSRDVRRIGLTAGLMIAILAVLHVLINVMGVISI